MTAQDTATDDAQAAALMVQRFTTCRAELTDPALDAFLDLQGDWFADQARKIVQKARKIAPKMDFGPDNPNTGKTSLRWSVGREGSPVLYATGIKTGCPGDWDGFLVRMLAYAKKAAHTDEADATEDTDLAATLRFWWD